MARYHAMTPARKAALRKAQLASARKRKGTGKSAHRQALRGSSSSFRHEYTRASPKQQKRIASTIQAHHASPKPKKHGFVRGPDPRGGPGEGTLFMLPPNKAHTAKQAQKHAARMKRVATGKKYAKRGAIAAGVSVATMYAAHKGVTVKVGSPSRNPHLTHAAAAASQARYRAKRRKR